MISSAKTDAVSVEQLEAAMVALEKVRKAMSLINLAPEERSHYSSIRLRRGLRTLKSRLNAAVQHPDLLPVAFDLRKFQRDAELTRVLQSCLALVTGIQTAVSDTLLVVGSQSVNAAILAYGYLKLASTPGEALKSPKKRQRRSRRARSVAPPNAHSPSVQVNGTPAQAGLPAPKQMLPDARTIILNGASSAVRRRRAA